MPCRSSIRPRSSTSNARKKALPPPTASEAALESLLEAFDPGVAQAPLSPAVSSLPQQNGEALPRVDDDRAFLDGLYARSETYLVRERFADIGEAESFHTKIVGVSFEGRQDRVLGLALGDELQLVREPANPYDPNAVAVRYGTLALGFLRREIAKRLAPKIDAGTRYTARVASVTGGGERNTGVNIAVRRVSAPGSAPLVPLVREPADPNAVRVALIGERPLREAQREVLARLQAGRNTLAVLGTGRGKSLCFQLPAAEAALARGEKTLVFYPLRALANDQYEALRRRLGGFALRIHRANGSIDGAERSALEAALEGGEWDIILATPEFATFHRAAFQRQENRPAFVVVDEAHHLFESSHRPAYGELGAFIRALGAPLVLALTATASGQAFAAIRSALGIDAWVIDPTVRENLHVVDARNTSDKFAYLARELAGERKAIVYCNSRAEVAKIAERLYARFGPCVAFYHAGVPAAERARVEDLFRQSVVRVIVATSAFGEGIDLPDVRDVVLYHLNFDFTEFNQMAGRAGRDGDDARIHLLYGDYDRRINDYIIARSAPSLEVLREIYRGMRGLAQADMLRMTYEDIARTLEVEMADGSTISAAVRIFEEAALLESGIDDDGRFVRFVPSAARVDLTATARFAEGRAERDGFERFCELALTADAPTLEQIVNRPIYPDRVAFEA